MTSVGFVGLGAMGAPMARRLLEAGHELTVWNRTVSRCEPLAAGGARVGGSPAEAARASDLVITMVGDPHGLRAVTQGPEGVLAGLHAGSVLVDMSTVGPAAVRELARGVPAGAGLLDAPVLGSIPEAIAGSLRIFVGGDSALVRRVEPVLRVLGDPLHAGPLGSGAAAKLVANSTLFAVLGALGEAIVLGEGLGLSREAVFEVLNATPLQAQAERRRSAIEAGELPAEIHAAAGSQGRAPRPRRRGSKRVSTSGSPRRRGPGWPTPTREAGASTTTAPYSAPCSGRGRSFERSPSGAGRSALHGCCHDLAGQC